MDFMKREDYTTPNGNFRKQVWVLRKNGDVIDYDKYRNDIIERHKLKIKE